MRCRYGDCPEKHKIAKEHERITCKTCRKNLSLPKLIYLEDFMNSSLRNQYIEEDGFQYLYVRKSFRRIQGEMIDKVFDIANVTSEESGKGTFTRFVNNFRKQYPEYTIYVESVLEKSFEKTLLNIGFVKDESKEPPCYYMLSSVCRSKE
jgi:hypothetical protein